MCGIFCIFGSQDAPAQRKEAVDLAKLLRHRGPDWSGVYCEGGTILAHERLAIVDPDSGDQPLYNEARDVVLCVNGEIYNHIELREQLEARAPGKHKFLTGSDCECLLHLYVEDGPDFLTKNEVCGMFAFAIWDMRSKTFVVARDLIGIIPLYMGWANDGSVLVSSELKALTKSCTRCEEFPPGHVYVSAEDARRQFYTPAWWDASLLPTKPIELQALREAFEKAVLSHMMSDVPYGVLLSGGLDSSLVASIMSRHCHRRIETDGREPAHWPQLHSFSIGLATSPDLKAAKEVAKYLGSVHHEYVFTPQEGIDALADVIYHLETFDVTTVRASTPMYLMARRIRATGVKMVLSGEGADEIFGGYLYFHKAPDAKEFHEENVRKVKQLHLYDCLRANKSMMAWGVEARVPFLDRRFMETALSFDTQQKMCRDEKGAKRVEKWVLRKAFDVPAPRAYLPPSVLWRQKEQFSDGVGYTWIDSLKAHAEKEVTDQQMATAANRFPLKTPRTKEAYLYRSLFAKHYGDNGAPAETVGWQDSIACSSATALKWDASFQGRADASGRCVAGVHEQAYDENYVTAAQDSGAKSETTNGESGNKRARTA
jgi:asparagine synthase (glutamine-hydrolysing)|mmetsp:Transcript_51282/g.81375  ORF Transcript_51282/g.81375 Transcript_51282/m.81375 type:complete len:600 (+) Transcript_51282:52-1851(+)|eukprot:CAMPEP_0169084494 /NCGR_PEP_ID=MMETSP1015-20121227/12657_1 /TAXON_ID=342587 /ORGANISM="Karlodinium micrum, Strain CCMP2283" /LENGTH=599 /DNA_ID=CAMNT_0009144519 /DNA_START=50 /DNA_END=1849 /DNA_ORIENTATION=+